MKAGRATRQHGAALLLLLAVVALGSSWYLVSRLNVESGMANAAAKVRNTQVLNRAKQALIGYIATQANFVNENRPGAFPCPEAPADFNVNGSEGTVSYPCTLPIVGRFPWRTLGMDKLVDASGEPLWYAIATGWAGAATVINSDCASPASGMACATGRLTVDSATNDVIVLIIAPGPATRVTASAGCAAWTQVRSTIAPPDWRNYLECENATSPADATFVTTSTNSAFNDQLVTITVGDLMPALEASIANRIQREILPALQTVFTPATWGFTGASTVNPVLPYPAAFANPGPGAGTSNYRGAAATYRGLLPFNQTQGCTEAPANPRCTTAPTGGTAFLLFSKPASYTDSKIAGSGTLRTSSASATCVWQSSVYVCTGEYDAPSISVSASVNVGNVAMGLRAWDASKVTCSAVDDVGNGNPETAVTCSATAALQSDGSAIVTAKTSALPDIASSGWGTYANYKIKIDRAAFGDHSLLDTANATTGWFVRNEWFRLVYYAVAASNTAQKLPAERSCVGLPLPAAPPNGDCLPLTTNAVTAAKSALLVLAGRSVNGSARPSTSLTPIFDYLEFGNADAANGSPTAVYESRTVSGRPTTPNADTGSANAYTVATIGSLSTGASFQFKATNTNTGTSTLNTTATGTRSLVNEDGSNLAAAAIQANAAVQVTWDGTKFLLSKRPYNDRVVAISSN